MASTSTTVSYPPFIEDAMKKVMDETNRLYQTQPRQFYPNDTVADFTPWQTQGQQILYQQLTDPNAVQNTVNKAVTANNAYLDPSMPWNLSAIPGYQGVRQGITDDVTRALSESWMPSVQNAAISDGAFGGSRGQIGEALAAGRASDALTKGLAGLDTSMFNTLLGAQQTAIGQAPTIAQLQLAPGQALNQLGGQQQNQAQSEITGARERYDFNQNSPWWLLDQLRTSAGMNAGSTTQGSTSSGAATGSDWLGLGASLLPAVLDFFKKKP